MLFPKTNIAWTVFKGLPEPVNEFRRDMNVNASIPIFRELLSPSGSEPQDVREMATFFADMQRQERR